jgi:toxin YoeB
MKKIWHDDAWADYLYWQKQDKKTLNRINMLIKDIDRNVYEGICKPEPLKHELSGWWSREIDEKNRIVYRIAKESFAIAQCGSHYRDK